MRTRWIDIAKGIGMIMIIYVHSAGRNLMAVRWMLSFVLPTYIILSGVTFNPDISLNKFVIKIFMNILKCLCGLIFLSIWDYVCHYITNTYVSWGRTCFDLFMGIPLFFGLLHVLLQ